MSHSAATRPAAHCQAEIDLDVIAHVLERAELVDPASVDFVTARAALTELCAAGIAAAEPRHALDVLADTLVSCGRLNRGTAQALQQLRRALGVSDA